MAKEAEKKADILFESSWEICNKVGGIYTVISSKAQQMINHYGKENYFCIGPFFHQKVMGEFQETSVPDNFKQASEELKEMGIACHFGKWLIKGEPNTILLDFEGFYSQTNDIKKKLWDWFQIDSLNSPRDVTEPMVWAYATGLAIEKLSSAFKDKKIVAHFHEWLSSAGILCLKKNTEIPCVFTTHATILGRSVSSNKELFEVLGKIDPDKEAYNYGIPTKYQLEKAAAHNADVFTTVSEVTGTEAEHLLKKKPDILLPNGLDMDSFPTFEGASIKHKEMKFRIKEFMLYNFFPYGSFNLDEALIFFTFSRYEFKNKGIDVFIKALAKLNDKLKEKESDKIVVGFLFVPTQVKSIRFELVENKDYYEDIRESVDNSKEDIRNRILVTLVSQEKLVKENIFPEDFLSNVKRKVLRFSKKGNPDICTHELANPESDAIKNLLQEVGLDNLPDDNVKAVFYPVYLTGADGLLNLDYYETIIGGHLGVFPSRYEPWGYTPLEAGALGVASITTDMAGFGQFINNTRPEEICTAEHCDPKKEKGIWVAKIREKSEDEMVEELYNIFDYYSSLDTSGRTDNKIEARRLASLADWKMLVNNYINAHNQALEKRGG